MNKEKDNKKPFIRTRQETSSPVRHTTLTFRVNDAERRIIEDRAQSCNKSVSDYLRQVVLGRTPRAAFTEEEREQLKTVSSLKFNLQQLNNYFHGHEWLMVKLENERIIHALKSILKT
jgi:uncharacterized protein (DUF1778 family)